jgi:hypothetical protein
MRILATIAVLALAALAKADIVLDKPAKINITNQKVFSSVITVTNAVAIPAGAKMVWTSFSIDYMPPSYTQAIYRVTYMFQDPVTKTEIPLTRKTESLTESQVSEFATAKNVDFSEMGRGIGFLLNAYLKSRIK